MEKTSDPKLNIFWYNISKQAPEIYKTVCRVDMCFFILALAVPIIANNVQNDYSWQKMIWMISAVCFLACSIKAASLLWDFKES